MADAELHGDVTVLIGRTMGNDLTALEFEHSHRNMLACIREDAGHADLLCDDT